MNPPESKSQKKEFAEKIDTHSFVKKKPDPHKPREILIEEDEVKKRREQFIQKYSYLDPLLN